MDEEIINKHLLVDVIVLLIFWIFMVGHVLLSNKYAAEAPHECQEVQLNEPNVVVDNSAELSSDVQRVLQIIFKDMALIDSEQFSRKFLDELILYNEAYSKGQFTIKVQMRGLEETYQADEVSQVRLEVTHTTDSSECFCYVLY